jgi:hypothetical protein
VLHQFGRIGGAVLTVGAQPSDRPNPPPGSPVATLGEQQERVVVAKASGERP